MTVPEGEVPVAKRVLIAEDDADIRTLLQIVLAREGVDVDVAANGREALDLLHSTRYALLILDLMMPVMSGVALIDRLREVPQEERPATVLVITAGRHQLADLDPSIVRGVVAKPFDVFEVAALIRDLLEDGVAGGVAGREERSERPPRERATPDSETRP